MNSLSWNNQSQHVWRFTPPNDTVLSKLQGELNIPPILATLLVQRGIVTADEANEFLFANLQSLPSPFLMKGMQRAVELIATAISNCTPILIYGDYDVDGVTATALLVRFFSEIGVKCISCHPDRFRHGYGLKAELAESALSSRPGLVITVDCGISDRFEVERLMMRGWQVIITDHHQPPSTLPKADAILNPWQEDCHFPFKELAGVGVAFYLVMGLRNYLNQIGYWGRLTAPNLKKYLDLVAIGTISDMVPLRGANRILTKAGLDVLSHTENLGLLAILERCRIAPGLQVNHEDIAYQIGPRLNAAGRMGAAGRASQLLSCNDQHLAERLADTIEQVNLDRRALSSELIQQAISQVEGTGELDSSCLILHNEDWHLGLLGIISSKLVDIYYKPTIIFGGQGTLKGSARSIRGINIHDLIADCAEEGGVIEYGGHNSAAGLSIAEENLPQLRKVINRKLLQGFPVHAERPTFSADAIISTDAEFVEMEQAWNRLAPYGQGNPEPIFITGEPCRLRNIQLFGKEKKHLRLTAFLAGRWVDGIGFGLGHFAQTKRSELAIAFSLRDDRFRGSSKTKLGLLDLFPCSHQGTVA